MPLWSASYRHSSRPNDWPKNGPAVLSKSLHVHWWNFKLCSHPADAAHGSLPWRDPLVNSVLFSVILTTTTHILTTHKDKGSRALRCMIYRGDCSATVHLVSAIGTLHLLVRSNDITYSTSRRYEAQNTSCNRMESAPYGLQGMLQPVAKNAR